MNAPHPTAVEVDADVDLDSGLVAYCVTAFASTRAEVGKVEATRVRHRRQLMLRTIRNGRTPELSEG